MCISFARMTRQTTVAVMSMLGALSSGFFPSNGFSQQAISTNVKQAQPTDSIDVVLAAVPLIKRDNAIIEILRLRGDTRQVFVFVTPSTTQGDLAQALRSISRSAASTVANSNGELRSFIYAAPNRKPMSAARAQQTLTLLSTLRDHGPELKVPGYGATRTLNTRIALQMVAVQR